MSPLKVAVIGLGRAGLNIHIARMRNDERFRITGVTDWVPERIQEVTSDLGCPGFPDAATLIAQAEADVEVAGLMGWEASSMLADGVIPTVEVSVEKVFSSELRQRIADLGIDLLGAEACWHTGTRRPRPAADSRSSTGSPR